MIILIIKTMFFTYFLYHNYAKYKLSNNFVTSETQKRKKNILKFFNLKNETVFLQMTKLPPNLPVKELTECKNASILS